MYKSHVSCKHDKTMRVFNILLLNDCTLTPVLYWKQYSKSVSRLFLNDFLKLTNLMNYQQINFSCVSVFSHEMKTYIFLKLKLHLLKLCHENKLMETMHKPFIDVM